MRIFLNYFNSKEFTVLTAVIILSLSSSFSYSQPGSGRSSYSIDPRAEERSYQFSDTGENLSYCVFKSSRVKDDIPAPLIVSLHGLGAGPQIMCNSSAVELAEEGAYILVAPMGYNVGGWYGSPVIQFEQPGVPKDPDALAPEILQEYSETDVMTVLAMVREEFNIDNKRIYLTGHSMGGAGTYFLGAKHADIWAAIAPVAPAAFLISDNRVEHLQKLADAGVSVMVVHGDEDEVVPVESSQPWISSMTELGVEYEYIELEGVGHGPVITLSQEYIYDFFDKHSK